MLEFEDIKNIIPHRYPILLVDRVLEIEKGIYCKGIKNISGSDNVFEGHFPGNPIMPGVLIVEALAQVGGLVIYSHYGKKFDDVLVLFGGIEKARFKRKVVPGDQLILESRLKRQRKNLWSFEGRASVDGDLSVLSEIKLAVTLKEEK